MGVIGWFGADVLDPPLPLIAKEIEAETVLIRVGFGQEAGAKRNPLRGIDQTLEDGVLDALAAILTQPGDPSEAVPTSFVASAYIVS